MSILRPNSARILRVFALAFGAALMVLIAQFAPEGAAFAQQTAPNLAQPSAQLQLPVPLVVEDLIVLDRNGEPVHGLKALDLIVTEGGKPVTLRNFEEHVAAHQPENLPKPPDLGPNVFTNVQRTLPSGPLYILLLDALNTPMQDQSYVRQQMMKYFKTLPAGLRVAVFGLGTRLYLLQGFTSNPEILMAAINNKRSRGASPLLDDPMTGAPVDQMSDTISEDMDTSDPDVATVVANLQQFEAEMATEQTRQRMIYTLQGMDELARYLSAFPGRKNLIWFSGSFPLNIFPDDTLEDPFGPVADFEDDVRQTTDLLARSRVAVYPVDGRGLFLNPAFSAAQSGASMMAKMRTNPGAFGSAQSKFFQQTAAEHATMDMIAGATGGKAFYNTNGLKEAVEKIAEYGENYYTLAYTPPIQKLDGGYRKVAIKCDQSGLHLDYRKGYFADDNYSKTRGPKVLPENAMTVAMMRGGPDAAQVLFDAMVVPASAPDDKITAGTKPVAKLMKPPYMSYTVQYLVDIHGATYAIDSKGVYHGALEFAAFLYNEDGELVNSEDGALKLDLPEDRFNAMSKTGLLAHLTIEAPVKGTYFLRVGVHDLPGDRVGAIEIPLASLISNRAMVEALNKERQAEKAK